MNVTQERKKRNNSCSFYVVEKSKEISSPIQPFQNHVITSAYKQHLLQKLQGGVTTKSSPRSTSLQHHSFPESTKELSNMFNNAFIYSPELKFRRASCGECYAVEDKENLPEQHILDVNIFDGSTVVDFQYETAVKDVENNDRYINFLTTVLQEIKDIKTDIFEAWAAVKYLDKKSD